METQSAHDQEISLVSTFVKPKIVIILMLICVVATVVLFQKGFDWYFVAIPFAALILIIIIGGYTSPLFAWTGFGAGEIKTSTATEETTQPKSTTTTDSQPGKSLWDWMQLLIVPIVLVLVVSSFNAQQNQMNVQNQLHAEQATALDNYLDRMSDLLFAHNLHGSKPGDEVLRVAQARTFTALQSVDENQKGVIIRFLYAADLITAVPNGYSIVRLDRVNLMGAILTKDLMDQVDLHNTFMNQANLVETTLTNTQLGGAILVQANLTGATITLQQLSEAKSLKGTIMPDGSLHP